MSSSDIENLKQKCKVNTFRADMWKTASLNHASEPELMIKLFGISGPFFDLTSISYYSFSEDGNSNLAIHWSKEGITTSRSLEIPGEIASHFMNLDYVILEEGSFSDTIPADIRAAIIEYFKEAGIKTSLAFHYPNRLAPRGYIAFSRACDGYKWSDFEIGLIEELVSALSLNAARIEAEEHLRHANAGLEEKIDMSSALLDRSVSELRKDIEERERSELALKESESLYRTLIQTCPDYIILTDLNLNVIMVNEAALRLNDINDESLLVGRNASEFLVPEDLPIAMENAKRLLETGELLVAEYTALKYDGTAYPAEFSVALVRDHYGNPKAFLAVIRNLSKHKMIEDALEKEKELFEITLKSISDCVITTGMLGMVLFLNKAAEKLTGWKQSEASGKKLEEVLKLIDEKTSGPINLNITALARSGDNIDFADNTLCETRSAARIRIEGAGSPIMNRNGVAIGCVLVFRDITGKKLLEENLLTARNLESLGTLAGGIAHDFNGILTALTANLALAKMYLGSEKPEVLEHLGNAEKSIQRSARLVNQLLTFSKGGSPIKESASIARIIEDSLELVLIGSEITWSMNVQQDLWQVEIDKAQVSQVASNIIFNAKEAMPDGGRLECTITNTSVDSSGKYKNGLDMILEQGDYVKVSFKDEGCGIPGDFLDRIFDPYFTTKPHGKGLGLTSVYSIIKKHGGFIRVESEEGKGTNFVFYLPAIKERSPVTLDVSARAAVYGARILVMDDDEDIGNILKKVLAKAGYSTTWVRDGSGAISEYENALKEGAPFGAVIMDLTVRGGMGGKDACMAILKIDPLAKIIVSSGYSNDPVISGWKNHGFADVLTKPFSIDKMLSSIERLLAGE